MCLFDCLCLCYLFLPSLTLWDFQTCRFAVLCKICNPYLNSTSGPAGIGLDNLDLLETTTAKMCRFVLEFFVQHQDGGTVLRPLTNSNFILDFWRFESAPYFSTFLAYLEHSSTDDMFDHSDSSHNSTPNYPKQYSQVLEYYQTQKILHTYGKFTLEGCMSSTPNTKSLQFVCGTDDATRKLAQMDYYKYRPVNLMFGFNAGIFEALQAFCEFNSLRKNQLLGFFAELQPALANAAHALQQAKKATKYRDYCEYYYVLW